PDLAGLAPRELWSDCTDPPRSGESPTAPGRPRPTGNKTGTPTHKAAAQTPVPAAEDDFEPPTVSDPQAALDALKQLATTAA
ncbi:hypothetical protein C6N75_10455, partial [Streptomyces solincola]